MICFQIEYIFKGIYMARTIIKAFCYQFCIATYILTQETFFNQLEQKLRFEQEQAITAVLYEADKVPQSECLALLHKIEDARNHIKQQLFGNSDQQYLWQPRQDTVTPKLLQNHSDLTLGDLSLYTAAYVNMLNIKPGIIKTAYKHAKKNKNVYACVKISDMEEGIYKIHFYVNWFSSQNKVFPLAGHNILHELTHIIECHPLIIGLIYNTLKPYYSCNGFTNNLVKKIHALRRVHETIADIAPLMWSNEISSIEKIRTYAYKSGILSTSFIDDLYLTADQRALYNDQVYNHHTDVTVEKLINTFNEIPTLKNTLVLKSVIYAAQVPIGLVIGAYVRNNILQKQKS